MLVKDLGEFGLIRRVTSAGLPRPERVICGVGDDAAVLHAPFGQHLLASTDVAVEGVHFLFDMGTPEDIGFRCLAANISDIAAMGGSPSEALIGLAVAPDTRVETVEGLYRGLRECAGLYGVNLVGGDTVRANGGMVVSITILGWVTPGAFRLRSGARPGDLVAVTGQVGGSAAGLCSLKKSVELDPEVLYAVRQRHFRPEPRVAEGLIMAGMAAVTAMNDISDGVANEAHEIAEASQVGLIINPGEIPISRETRLVSLEMGQDPLDFALYGGEDFEIILTVHPDEAAEVRARVIRDTGTNLSVIGEVIEGDGVWLRSPGGLKGLPRGGFNHLI